MSDSYIDRGRRGAHFYEHPEDAKTLEDRELLGWARAKMTEMEQCFERRRHERAEAQQPSRP